MHQGATSDASFTSLYRQHFGWLQGWARRRLGCSHRAADLAQATFCRLLEHGALPALETPRSYLATVARRLLIDDVRRRDLETAWRDACLAAHDTLDGLTPERIAEAAELLEGILALLDALPRHVRRAFVLRRIEGLEQDAIAVALGVSTRTVKRYIAEAYVQLYAFAYPAETSA